MHSLWTINHLLILDYDNVIKIIVHKIIQVCNHFISLIMYIIICPLITRGLKGGEGVWQKSPSITRGEGSEVRYQAYLFFKFL